MQTPLLLLWFNRPDHAQKVLNRLRTIRPTTIYVVVDGPRKEHLSDAVQVQHTVALLDTIDWPCTLHRQVREHNLGCKQGVSSAINWFFEQVEEGIILEDDCLPDPTFFSFCTDLLARYQTDERVMHIGGANLTGGTWWGDDSYLFTKVTHIWGWASWRRAWQHYDLAMTSYPSQRDTLIDTVVDDVSSRRLWKQVFDDAYAGRIDTWDYQWVYSIWAAGGLSILPSVNLITNIGFDAQATHTKFVTEHAGMATATLPNLSHPVHVFEYKDATQWLFRNLYRQPSRLTAWLNILKRRISLLKNG